MVNLLKILLVGSHLQRNLEFFRKAAKKNSQWPCQDLLISKSIVRVGKFNESVPEPLITGVKIDPARRQRSNVEANWFGIKKLQKGNFQLSKAI